MKRKLKKKLTFIAHHFFAFLLLIIYSFENGGKIKKIFPKFLPFFSILVKVHL